MAPRLTAPVPVAVLLLACVLALGAASVSSATPSICAVVSGSEVGSSFGGNIGDPQLLRSKLAHVTECIYTVTEANFNGGGTVTLSRSTHNQASFSISKQVDRGVTVPHLGTDAYTSAGRHESNFVVLPGIAVLRGSRQLNISASFTYGPRGTKPVLVSARLRADLIKLARYAVKRM